MEIELRKKGNIPITILVLGVFAVCTFALLTFFISDFQFTTSFVGVGILNKINSNSDGYSFYRAKGVEINKLDFYFNIFKERGKKYFFVERSSGDWFFWKGEQIFSVKYYLP